MKKPLTYEEMRKRDLADFATALHYLQFALEENDLAHFMAAFANVVEAQGGAGKFSEKTHLSRQTIYNAMKNKSLRADSLFEIVRGLGLQFELVALEKAPAKKKAAGQKVLVAR
jgi:DNA-binding phage protein